MKLFIALACCFLLLKPLAARAEMALFDGDNDRIGTLLGFDGGLGVRATVHTADGILISVDTVTGLVWPQEEVYFATAECSGQGYVPSSIGPDDKWARRGGAIFRDNASQDKHAKIEWNPSVVTGGSVFTNDQCWQSVDCGGAPRFCGDATEFVPVSYVDDAEYGFKENPHGGKGFLPPITGQVQTKGGAIFCDGFENCPQQ